MANRTITLKSQAINVFGPSPTQRWGSFTWGVDTWGMKAAGAAGSPHLLVVLVRPTLSVTWTGNNSVGITYSNAHVYLTDGRGYYSIFIDRTTDHELSTTGPAYTSLSVNTTNYTGSTSPATTWS